MPTTEVSTDFDTGAPDAEQRAEGTGASPEPAGPVSVIPGDGGGTVTPPPPPVGSDPEEQPNDAKPAEPAEASAGVPLESPPVHVISLEERDSLIAAQTRHADQVQLERLARQHPAVARLMERNAELEAAASPKKKKKAAAKA